MTKRAAVPPQRYIALLRAINVGRHVVKMDRLRTAFEALRFGRVETFIASGNVLFDSPEPDTATLEQMIERRLEKELGYEVATFLRKPFELAAIASSLPFGDADLAGCILSVAFLKRPPSTESTGRLHSLRTETDDLLVRERELYWRCRGSTMESKIWRTPLEKVIGMPATFRNLTTVRKLAAKC
ncbi:MAG: DUF1697 domain-containing protein [Gemmatimonadota bacterium]|nr:DUF1697 domain-containing protein [Gemmatimonadota bacterium]